MGFAGLTSLIHDGSSSQLTGLEGSAANVLVPQIPQETFRGLVESIPRRVGTVLAAHGGSTAYWAGGHNVLAHQCMSYIYIHVYVRNEQARTNIINIWAQTGNQTQDQSRVLQCSAIWATNRLSNAILPYVQVPLSSPHYFWGTPCQP